ncbi:polysaccharide biosynthesis protein, partial [Mycoplasma marinum]
FTLVWNIKIRDEIDFHSLLLPTLIRIGGLVLVNTDELILGGTSYSMGVDKSLLLISVYSSYLVFFNLINSVLNNIFGSLIFSIGSDTGGDFSLIKSEKIKKALVSSFVITFGTFALIALTSPYVVNFVFNANNKDEYFSKITALLFGFMGILYAVKMTPITIYKIQGQWKKYAFLVIFEVVINIVLSLILVKYLDMNGLLIATIIAQTITVPVYFVEYYKLSRQVKKT